MLGQFIWRVWMNCDEFLSVFREALDAKVPDQIINDNVAYYRSYINNEVRKGRSEEDVIESLGNPRLLARTIEESTKFAEGEGDSYYDYGSDNTVEGDNGRFETKQIKLPGWLVGIIVAIVIIFVLAIVFKVAFFLAPYIIAFLIAGFIVKEIRNWINRY
jgi:uncharacterized membrane protein